MKLAAYLARIGVSAGRVPRPDLKSLALLMDAQSRAIAFENFDVVLGRRISMARPDVEQKLVHSRRGGYCWELNTLLEMALEELGFDVSPLMCRVRWGKPDDSDEPNTTFTHSAIKVRLEEGDYLADVGFSGVNSSAPVALHASSDVQELPEGRFRVVPSVHPPFSVLQLLVKGEWRPLYEWRDERAAAVDMECSNWFSCTYPTARFTNQLFTSRVIGEERHHILDGEYVVRKGHGVDSEVRTTQIADKQQLLELIDSVFGVQLGADDTDGLDRYLAKR